MGFFKPNRYMKGKRQLYYTSYQIGIPLDRENYEGTVIWVNKYVGLWPIAIGQLSELFSCGYIVNE